ncbi:pyrroline-5-carboxylate reductase family protein [Arthrobacter sp. NPDC058130]|uniref:pyrroline-5-carboxylate reductase family protein n=1 Tax=Arthrobacter sp. NPDC058130 TaxID=3346353 RepID=UPI0036E37EAD
MPNLGGQVGFGVTGIGYHGGVSEEQLRVIREVWSTVGKVVIVRDDQLDAVSSISGTGPAYFYYFAEQLTAAAAELGFTPEQSRLLAEQTFVGAAAVMQRSGGSSRDLLRYITNPAGTFIRAVREMANHDLKGMLVTAASATMVRAKEIAEEAESDSRAL